MAADDRPDVTPSAWMVFPVIAGKSAHVMTNSATRRADLFPSWDELGRCHGCGHWRADYCNMDGFSYCDDHYPEELR